MFDPSHNNAIPLGVIAHVCIISRTISTLIRIYMNSMRRLNLTDGLCNGLIIDGCVVLRHKDSISTVTFLAIYHWSTSLSISHRLQSLLHVVLHQVDARCTRMHEGALGLFRLLQIKHAQGFGDILRAISNRGVFLVAVCTNCNSAFVEFALAILSILQWNFVAKNCWKPFNGGLV